ncbi:MAG: hypothetical protein CFE40_01250 [Burkholderiales bacterium PBB1]|nr:MAG: hypothetical protein CFE40_01250 [Burkholderiales bacterium PBB1]
MHRDPFLRWAGRIATLGAVALVTACASPSPRSSGSAAAPPPTLAQERQRLADLFDGTPVVLAIDRDGSLRAEVPLRFCFEPARAVVKPPLAALLDRLATSPATRGGNWLVAAPGDPTSKDTALATQRARSVRDHLVGRGAMATKVAIGSLGWSGGPSTVVRVVVSVPSGSYPSR